MGVRRHGKGEGGHLPPPPPPGNVVVLFVLQMSRVSVDEVFMHYFEKMHVVSGEGPRPPPGLCP